MPMGLNEQQMREIHDLLDSGKIIGAIKEVRIMLGVGLKEAKGIVDIIRANPKSPNLSMNEVAPGSLSAEQAKKDHSVLEFLRQSQKIKAIRRFREITNLGLKDAKLAVESIGSVKACDFADSTSLTAQKSNTRKKTSMKMNQIAELAQSGQIIMAIKLYREETGVGLREAKMAVDAMVIEEE